MLVEVVVDVLCVAVEDGDVDCDVERELVLVVVTDVVGVLVAVDVTDDVGVVGLVVAEVVAVVLRVVV